MILHDWKMALQVIAERNAVRQSMVQWRPHEFQARDAGTVAMKRTSTSAFGVSKRQGMTLRRSIRASDAENDAALSRPSRLRRAMAHRWQAGPTTSTANRPRR